MPEKSKVAENSEVKIQPFSKIRYLNGNIPVEYSVIGSSTIYQAMMPPYLAISPKVGDIIETIDGTPFEIKTIIHTIIKNTAGVRLEIGQSTGGQSPIGGIGASQEPDI